MRDCHQSQLCAGASRLRFLSGNDGPCRDRDRVTAAGDVCNKVGTYLKALAAHDNGVPFYAAQPLSTIDWSLDAGVDIRDTILTANNARLNSFLVGGRVVAKPLAEKFKPYLQLSVGVGSSKPPHSPIKLNRLQYGIYGGLDYTLAKHVDFRAFELGYGAVSTINSGNFNGTTSFSASRMFSVSTGLVFRVP